MEPILDEQSETGPASANPYARKSIRYLLSGWALVGLALALFIVPGLLQASHEIWRLLASACVMLTVAFGFFGFSSGIKALRYKEQPLGVTIIGIVGNAVFVGIPIALIVINLIDFIRALG